MSEIEVEDIYLFPKATLEYLKMKYMCAWPCVCVCVCVFVCVCQGGVEQGGDEGRSGNSSLVPFFM